MLASSGEPQEEVRSSFIGEILNMMLILKEKFYKLSKKDRKY